MLRNKLATSAVALGLLLGADSSFAAEAANQEAGIKSVTLAQFKTLGEQPGLRRLKVVKGPDAKETHSIAGVHKYPLEVLDIEFTKDLDTSPLGHLKQLNALCVRGAGMPTDPALIAMMEKQLKIEVPKENLHQFEFLRYLNYLAILQVDMASFDLGVITELKHLAHIQFNYCDFAKANPGFMEVFATLPSLRVLTLKLGRELWDISALSSCRNLTTLVIPGTNVASIEPLRGLPIQYLDVSGCPINNISFLAELKKLELLAVSEPSYEGWDGLRGHPALRRVKVTAKVLLIPSPQKLALIKQLDAIDLNDPKQCTPENIQLFQGADAIMDGIESYPLQVLKTVPLLELIAVPVISVPDELLEDLKKDKPNVVFGDFEDWAKRDLE